MKDSLEQYLENLSKISKHGDAREESYYKALDELLNHYAEVRQIKNIDITILPKKTEAGNPDFRVWDGKNHITGYIEAKAPSSNLDNIEEAEQLKRYLTTFPNVILTNFYEFRLYRDGQPIAQVMIGRPIIVQKLQLTPPLENIQQFVKLFDLFFSFSLPKVQNAYSLAIELAKRTRFLRDEVISVEIEERENTGHKKLIGFYEAFKKYLIASLTKKQFADIYAQTITYGLFVAKTRSDTEFNRKLAFDFIPSTIGILRDIFRFISLEDPPKSLQIIVDDIAEILNLANTQKILHEYQTAGKGRDPIIHFYETFLANYDPEVRERRGVYYTPEPIVSYIVRSIHSILKSHFGLADGLASEKVKLLDPAGGTLTFPAEAIRVAVEEFKEKYGEGGLHQWIKTHILANFHSFELMMAPYAIGHLKIGFILEELGCKMADDERFKLYLTNTLEMEDIEITDWPGVYSLSEESNMAGKIKNEKPLLVIMGNPPYSGHSANKNEWTELLLKNDNVNGIAIQSYYKVDGQPLGEKNSKWLQDDYVKFLRFAQWKIQKAGYGVVGMITNHSYLNNPTFRGMRQSLMKTFDEIYIIDLHGNSLKKETAPDGRKDENVFDIRQGVAIALFIKNFFVKNKKPQKTQVFHKDLFGLREEKYAWLNKNDFLERNYTKIEPQTPYYFLLKRDIEGIKKYLNWTKITEMFPLHGVGMTTARDDFVIDFKPGTIVNRISSFKNSKYDDERLYQFFQINKKKGWEIRKAWKMLQHFSDSELEEYIHSIAYRPFDNRYIFWHDSVVWRTVKRLMYNMLEENIAIITARSNKSSQMDHFFITNCLMETKCGERTTQSAIFPLYIYPYPKNNELFNHRQTEKNPNINTFLFEKLEFLYNHKPTPEEILYYIYGVFYSNIYRTTYAEFLKIDFPRVPFTDNYEIFKKISELGRQLTELHLLKSQALDNPTAKFQGTGTNDKIKKIVYQKDKQRIYINKNKYFEGIHPDVWDYQIGGYQVLQKYLKDRKGSNMDNAPHYCRIITALDKTIDIQEDIDKIYPEVEKELAQ